MKQKSESQSHYIEVAKKEFKRYSKKVVLLKRYYALFLEMSVVFAFFNLKPRATFFMVGLNLTIADQLLVCGVGDL